MQDAVADVIASRARLEPPLSRFLIGSIAAHLLLGVMLVVSTRMTPAAEKKHVINVRLSSGGSAGAAAATPANTPRATPARPPAPQPSVPATPVPMTRPVPPPETRVTESPRKAAAGETLFGKSNLPVAANPTPTTTAAPVQSKAPDTPAATPVTGSAPAGTGTAEIGTLPGVGKAGVMALEGGPFPFSDYLERMIGLIGRRWQRPQTGASPTATVYFIVERNGRVRDVEISEPSGVGSFDRAAMRAVLESSPLPPLPPGYSGQWLGVHLAFH